MSSQKRKQSEKPNPSSSCQSSSSNTIPSKKRRKTNAKAVISGPPFQLYTFTEKDSTPTFREGFASVAKLLEGRKNILVLTGAGTSVSCGIPDFRSKGTGLYSTLDSENLGLDCAEDLFDLETFKEDPRPFFRFARALYPSTTHPSTSHRFLALLERKKMLLRVFTQNIDGLEEIAGVSPKRVVHAHGSLGWASCMKCKNRVSASEIADDVMACTVPRCSRPLMTVPGRKRLKRENSNASSESSLGSRTLVGNDRIRRQTSKMSSTTDNGLEHGRSGANALPGDIPLCGGVMKPGVTFFGEKLSDKVRKCLEADRSKADALIVIGTSLSVAPMSKIIRYLCPTIPRILINRNAVKPPKQALDEEDSDDKETERDFRDGYVFDACLLGFCDDVTRALVKEMTCQENGGTEDGKNGSIMTSDDGQLLAEINDDTRVNKKNNWKSMLPEERTFVFPGAILDTNDDSDSDITYKEIAHCDGCQKEIHGTIMKCTECFDYDLCKKCYDAGLSKKHCGGEHEFVAEKQ